MLLMSDEDSIAALQSLSKEQKQFFISKQQQLLSSAEVIWTRFEIINLKPKFNDFIKRITTLEVTLKDLRISIKKKATQEEENSESETKDKENGIDKKIDKIWTNNGCCYGENKF